MRPRRSRPLHATLRPMEADLDHRLRDRVLDGAVRYAPWRPGVPWWVIGIQGAALLATGLILLLVQGATTGVVALFGLVLLVLAIAWAWSAMRGGLPAAILPWRAFRAGAGVAVGAILVLDLPFGLLGDAASLAVLAVGLFLVGALGCVEWAVGRDVIGWRWPSLIGPVVALLYGLIVLVSRLQAGPLFVQTVALLLLAVGGILLVRAGILWQQIRVTTRADAAETIPREPAIRPTEPPPGTTPAPRVPGRTSPVPPIPRSPGGSGDGGGAALN